MKTLSENWFAEGTIDFEYKQYILLAYLEEVKRHYAAIKLYPTLSDLIGHHHNLRAYQAVKQQLHERAPKKVVGFDAQQLAFVYAQDMEPGPLMEEIDQIVAYSLPQVQASVEEGTQLYEYVEAQLQLMPIGVVPLYKDEGYVLLRVGSGTDILVYQYSLSLLNQGQEKLRALHTQFVTTYTYSISQNYDSMKLALVRSRRELPNPATFAIECTLQVPLAETVLPVAKRRLLRMLVQATV